LCRLPHLREQRAIRAERARGSGAPVDVRWAAIFEVVDQRIVRVDVHGKYAKALEAAGLRE
jgi:hypothetical protein